MAEQDRTNSQLRGYLQQLTPQVRSRLLAELERLHLLGQDMPQSEGLIAALRAEFRNAGESHYRVGNPSRYFFEPLEPVLVDCAPELASRGQIARSSLAPIWSLVTEKLLPSMAADYVANAKKVILADKNQQARQLAGAFQKKVASYLEGVLKSADGAAATRAALEIYTSSQASFDDLTKMLHLLNAQNALRQFDQAVPSKMGRLDRELIPVCIRSLNSLRRKHPEAVPFALTVIARRLDAPSDLIQFATTLVNDHSASRVAAGPYGVAVSMVLDQIAQKHPPLRSALRQNSVLQAKEILQEIYRTENTVRTQVDLAGSDWGSRLDDLMAAVHATVNAEIDSIPSDHRLLIHALESSRLQPQRSLTGSFGGMIRSGRQILVGLLPGRNSGAR